MVEVATPNTTRRVHFRACSICEAMCGLRIEVEGDKVLSIRPDQEDPFSRGHICPKGVAMQDIHYDPDRLRKPMRRTGATWTEIEWDEAYDMAAENLASLVERYGPNSIANYVGNPTSHSSGLMTHSSMLFQIIGSKMRYSVGSVDSWPNQLTCYLMYGHQFYIPIADLDNTKYFLIVGANPLASNGSLMSVPDFPGRMKDMRARGGKMVVIDPRRTESAKVADQHFFIRPGADAWLLLAMVHVLFRDGLVRLGCLAGQVDGIDAVRAAVEAITPQRAAQHCGISAEAIEQLTQEFSSNEPAVAYGRMGACVQEFGTLTMWAVHLLNLLTGNLDREGGVMLPQPASPMMHLPAAAGTPDPNFRSRVQNRPSMLNALPLAALPEEILTPGEGQIHGLITVAGNPAVSAPDSKAIDEALSELDFMMSIDWYLNETTRHAHLILPPVSPLERSHFDHVFYTWSVRNAVRYNSPVFEKPDEGRHDWEILNAIIQRFAKLRGLSVPPQPTSDQVTDAMLKAGPYPDMSVDMLRKHPHGIDLGPLRPNLADKLAEQKRNVQAAPQVMLDDIPRLLRQSPLQEPLVLIGRRHVRSNNSWMNNYHRLVKGKPHNHLLMHPEDLSERGISDGSEVEIVTETGSIRVAVTATDDVMRGVVCLPHGWGQNKQKGVGLSIASAQTGANFNDISSRRTVDVASGTSVLNGIPVTVRSVRSTLQDDEIELEQEAGDDLQGDSVGNRRGGAPAVAGADSAS